MGMKKGLVFYEPTDALVCFNVIIAREEINEVVFFTHVMAHSHILGVFVSQKS